MAQQPTFSIIIPAYNQGRYVAQAVRSVLEQTRPDFEIIVVDDGSTDDTRQAATASGDPRVLYLYQENRGLSAARNTGIRHARGAYLSYLDSDDAFMPRKLELLLEKMNRSPELGLSAGQAIPVDEEGNPIGQLFDRPLPDDPAQLLLGNPLHVGSVLMRREWQEQVGFFDESLRSYEDWDMWLRLARLGCPMRSIAQPVSLYRFHGMQMTRLDTQMTAATFIVLDKTFADPALPPEWRDLRSVAYSRANLRGAAQAYQAGNHTCGAEYISTAVALDATLAANDGERLTQHFNAWIELPKFSDPIGFLEAVYTHLPPELDFLRSESGHALGRAAMQVAFDAYTRGDLPAARRAALRAFRHDPRWLGNRGAVSVLVRSHLQALAGRRQAYVSRRG